MGRQPSQRTKPTSRPPHAAAAAASAPERNRVEELGEEFVARYRRGENPSVERYVREYPPLADEIRELFPAMLAMERLKARRNVTETRPVHLGIDRLEQLGDYRIVGEIGRGGMGVVYEAEQQSIGRPVALKVFPRQAIGDSKQLKRFQREAQTAGRLHHTNIVPVFGVGQQDGLHYYVMQRLEGLPLDQLLSEMIARAESTAGPIPDPVRWVFEHRGRRHVASRQSPESDDASSGPEPSSASCSEAPPPSRLPASSEPSPGPTTASRSSTAPHSTEITPTRETLQVVPPAPAANVPAGLIQRFGVGYWRTVAEIGEQVASALRYAHGQGVMHRDVKPSNLIIDADHQAWVTDFGLAVGPSHDRLSHSGDVVGTLRYMAPERLHGHCDPRCDLYSLGLTLYEMVTLRPAFAADHRGSLIRQVSTGQPTPPRTLCPGLPRDLETIILKAIAREPSDRYQTAGEMRGDLQRFLDDQPIRARRMSTAERAFRWTRRNPAIAAMLLLVICGAAASFAAIGWQWQQALEETHRAEMANRRAENNLTLALDSLDGLLEQFESDWMAHPVASDAESEDGDWQQRFIVSTHSARVLEKALAFYHQFAEQNQANPQLQRDTALAYRRAGDIHDRLGQYAQAAEAFGQAAELMRAQRSGAKDPDWASTIEVAQTHNRLGLAHYAMYRNDAAREQFERAKRILGDHLLRHEATEPCVYELALTHSNLGKALWRMHEKKESAQRHRRAILLLEQLVEDHPDTARYRLALARAYQNYYPFAAFGKERSYARQIQSASADLLEALVSDFPGVPDYSCELAEMLTRTARWGRGERATKIAQVERAIELARALEERYHTIPRYQAALAEAVAVRGSLADDPARAERLYGEAVRLYEDLCQRFPEVASYQSFIARALLGQGNALRELDQLENSRHRLKRAVEHQQAYLATYPQTHFGRKWLSRCYDSLAETLAAMDRPEESACYQALAADARESK